MTLCVRIIVVRAFIGVVSTCWAQENTSTLTLMSRNARPSTMALVDQRASGVSPALRARIGPLLDGGATVSLRRNSLVLRDVVLTRASGTETPAAAEMRLQVARRGLDSQMFNLERWNRQAALERAGNQTFAYDRDGNRHMVTRRRNGQQVATVAGRRFYRDAPLTQWIFQVPIANRRAGGALWRQRYMGLTEGGIAALGLPIDLAAYSFTRAGTDEAATLMRLRDYVTPIIMDNWGRFVEEYEYEDQDVEIVYDYSRPLTFDMQRTGVTNSGAMSVDTLLDRVVFGLPVTSPDLWAKCHLHEASRRRNGECGIDVIVASGSWRQKHSDGCRTTRTMFTAEQAACELVKLAKEHFPDSALALACSFEGLENEAADQAAMEVDKMLFARGLVKTTAGTNLQRELEAYLPKMLQFLQKGRNFEEIWDAMQKGNIFRQTPKQKKAEMPLPAESCAKALARLVPWSRDPKQRLLLFLRLFKFKIVLQQQGCYVAKDSQKRVQLSPEAPTAEATAAREALQKHGTPMRLLEMFYKKLNVRLIIYNGATCRYVHTPEDWELRAKDDKHTVVMNVWDSHVFTYTRAVHDRQFQEHAIENLPDTALITLRDEERYKFEHMKPLDWSLLLETYQEILKPKEETEEGKQNDEKQQEGKRGTVFWTTTEMDEKFFEPLEQSGMDIAFTPYWPSSAACTSVFIPIGDKTKAGIRIKKVPQEHRALQAFCRTVQQRLQVKLQYNGESSGLLCHKFIQQLLVRRRETIRDEDARKLLEKQGHRCFSCGDMLKKYEKHHIQALAEGGSNAPENLEPMQAGKG